MKVSVVINTDGRAGPLATCLDSLRYLRYPDFEVVVVAGPTPDGTHELCESWGDRIKYGRCPVRNLSVSRNIGIAMASGDIVAYIDDDAVPEPEWLDDIVKAFEDPQVGVAGGFLHDHTGKTYQWEYGTTDRLGNADQGWTRPAPEFNFPLSFSVPHVIGANSVFRREALEAIGGFDEEFEYYLDETDVTTRIVDEGWTVAQLRNAFVHHKFMASHIRNHSKVLTSWYPIVKNMAYFGLTTGAKHVGIDVVLANTQRRITEFRYTAHWALENKLLTEADVHRFEEEAQRGLRDGLSRGVSGQRKLPPEGFLRRDRRPFASFDALLPASRQRCYVLLSRNYPPANLGGIGRYIHQLARTLAGQGHQVHVLTAGDSHDRVDFEQNIWVHRIVVKHHDAPEAGELSGIPSHIWNYSRTMLDEAREVAARRKVEAVYAPIWDAEGIAFLGRAEFPLVTSLQTTLRFYLDSNPKMRADTAFMGSFAEPMLRAERALLEKSDGIHAISDAIARDIEAAYGMNFDRGRLWTVPLGLEDWTSREPAGEAHASHGPTVCFVGRLESRKGVDVVMRVAKQLLREFPDARLMFVGNDKLASDDGRTWRERFESQEGLDDIAGRVIFRGEVSDEELRDAYRFADVILAPSRFESFGLVHLEGAMYGKPVVGCRVGGMVEVIADGVTGLLAEPGDAASLLDAIRRLLADAALRGRIGEAARSRYLQKFTPERMADGVTAMIAVIASRERPDAKRVAVEVVEVAEAPIPTPVLSTSPQPLKIAVIGSVLVPHDAISNDLARKVRFLRETPGWQVSVLAGYNERRDVVAKVVPRMSDMLLTREFREADVIIYHFGIYYPQFDAILLGNGHARQAVVFHNITPLEHTPAGSRKTIEKSFEQLEYIRCADAVWPDSRENRETLLAHGMDPARMTIQPLAVDRPARHGFRKARGQAIELLFIGRIVPSKGIQDLVEALARLDAGLPPIRVRMIGNLESADAAFVATLRARAKELAVSGMIHFAGAVSDDERDAMLAESHILVVPSYHEGFCVPVIEAMRAGMLPVVYSAHNLRYIADGLCVSSPPGDIPALAAAVSRAIADVHAALANPAAAKIRLDRGEMTVAEFESAVSAHVDQFEPEIIAQSLRARVQELVSAPPASPRA